MKIILLTIFYLFTSNLVKSQIDSLTYFLDDKCPITFFTFRSQNKDKIPDRISKRMNSLFNKKIHKVAVDIIP